MKKINFQKMNGLVPAIIQDTATGLVLMLGFMNQAALQKTIRTKKVWFYSRTKKQLWMKGEKSKNILQVISITPDCDSDTLLIKAKPLGPTCHTGKASCFPELNRPESLAVLDELFSLIKNRQIKLPKKSYTTRLFLSGLDRIAQKVGEEAIEVVLAAKNESKMRLASESADLLYHLLVLWAQKNIIPDDIVAELKTRRPKNSA